MNREDVIALLDVQRKVFNDFIDRLQQDFRASHEETRKTLSEVTRSLEYSQAELEDTKRKMNSVCEDNINNKKQMSILMNENMILRNKIEEIEDRTDYMDDQRRQINLRITGIQESAGENWQQSQQKLSNVLNDRLNLNPTFEKVYRVGKPSVHHSRDIIARFSNLAERDAVFRERRRLKGSNVFINEDLCSRTLASRREQMDEYHSARKEGKIVYFNFKKLVVREPNTERGRGGLSSHGPSYVANSTQSPIVQQNSGPVNERESLDRHRGLSVAPVPEAGETSTPQVPPNSPHTPVRQLRDRAAGTSSLRGGNSQNKRRNGNRQK